jgi:uncharacterized surface protein with fasciclin (FAS1) repeats
MVSEYFTRSTALTGLVLAGALALGACQATSNGSTTAAATEAETGTVAATEESATSSAAVEGDVIEVASASGDFTTLVSLLEAAGLTATLEGQGPFTVFAPNDAAFAALPAGTVDALMLPENRARLAQILSYHVVSGSELAAADFSGQTLTVATLEGRDIEVNGSNGVMVNNATVITPDIDATNGVIHVIDTVLIP